MINQICKMNLTHKYALLDGAIETLECWGFNHNLTIKDVKWCKGRKYNVIDIEDSELDGEAFEESFVLLKCQCGEYITESDSYGEHEWTIRACHHCGEHYEYTKEEIRQFEIEDNADYSY